MLLDNIHCETLPPINNTCGESSQGQVDHGGRVCGGVTGGGVVGWTNTISEANSIVEKCSNLFRPPRPKNISNNRNAAPQL